EVRVAATVHRDTDETLTFHTQLATVGPPVTQGAQSGGGAGRLVDLPPTPWLHSRYWLATRSRGPGLTGAHPLLGLHVEMPAGGGHIWQADVGTEDIPWLGDHQVHGQPVMPAAGFAEIALAAGSQALGVPVAAVGVYRLEVEQMLALDDRTRITTQLLPDPQDGFRVEIHSRT